MGSSRKSPRRRCVWPPSRSLPIFEREAMIRKRFSTRPMPIRRRTCDIGVDVQENAFRTCTSPIPQVAERLGVAPRPSERRCRPGPQGRGRERPPFFGAWYGTGEGRDVQAHSTLPRGSLPVHQSFAGRPLKPSRLRSHARRHGGVECGPHHLGHTGLCPTVRRTAAYPPGGSAIRPCRYSATADRGMLVSRHLP